MMTKDEILIEKLKAKRASIIAIATEEIRRIDARIVEVASTPRYARPKQPRALSAKQLAAIAAREADQRLRDELASKRDAAARNLAGDLNEPDSQP